MQVVRRRAQGDKAGTTSLLPSVILSERSESKDLVQNIKAVPNTAKEFVTVRLRARPVRLRGSRCPPRRSAQGDRVTRERARAPRRAG